jgi:hypothetical protein
LIRRSIAVAMTALGMLMAASVAQADTQDIIEPQGATQSPADGWQTGTCTTDTPQCSVATPAQFFKTAGGHPPSAFTQYIIRHGVDTPFVFPSPPFPAGTTNPVLPLIDPFVNRSIETLRVDLPPGLTVNPEATAAKCPLENFHEHKDVTLAPGVVIKVPNCPAASKVGEEKVTAVTNVDGVPIPTALGPVVTPRGFVVGPSVAAQTQISVFNIEPEAGEPALFGFLAGGKEEVFLRTEVSWESDYHESFTIQGPEPAIGTSTLISRLINVGTSGNGTYITNPTTCFDPEAAATDQLYSTWFRARSFGEPNPTFPVGSTPFESKLPEHEGPEGCESIPFDPSIDVEPGTNQVDSPASPTVTTSMPFEDPSAGGNVQGQSHLRSASVTMPAGMGLNPSGSVGLEACKDADFRKGVRANNNTCPSDSIVGSAEIVTPVLDEPLEGDIYVGQQKSTDPASGEEFRILVEAKSEELGIVTRLIGNVAANPVTGQLTTTFDEQQVGPLAGPLPKGLPQVPFEDVILRFDGARKVLSSPPICASADTTSTMVPWSDPAATAHPGDSFTLTNTPTGGACPVTLAQRAFAPVYTANTDSSQAGAFSPFRVHIGRTDGQQEIKDVDVTLPKGLTGKLAGIPYCSEGAIAAAASRSGKDEEKAPSCKFSSLGSVVTTSGTGANPLRLTGNVVLAGPYKGAPLSLVAITPAVSGPFDLGNVVVRVALNVDPTTAQIHAVSDVIPDVFSGVKLDLRTIDFDIDRDGFMVNPTNCSAQATTGAIKGGGANPADPAAFSSSPFSTPFAATGCEGLGFKPKLTTTLSGPTKRAKYPRLTAVLEARKGDANIASTTLALPHAFFVAQEHIKTVCTKPQLASHTCPASSVYGEAEAESPLLDEPLKGLVHLVPGGHKLPDLVADLRGQVDIQLHGVISSKKGGIKTVFDSVPDVAVKKFTLKMKGGKKGLIVNSTNICKGKQLAQLDIQAQNGKRVKTNKYKLNLTSCGKKAKKGKKGKK